MLKKIGKKQLLGILTATAIVVTTVGSFAVWDKLTAEQSTSSISFVKPIDTKMESIQLTEVANPDEGTMAYEGTVTVKSENLPAGETYKLDLKSELTGVAENDGISTVIGKDGEMTAATYTDNSYTGTGDVVYKVRVTATREKALEWTGEKSVTAKVTAQVSPTTTP